MPQGVGGIQGSREDGARADRAGEAMTPALTAVPLRRSPTPEAPPLRARPELPVPGLETFVRYLTKAPVAVYGYTAVCEILVLKALRHRRQA